MPHIIRPESLKDFDQIDALVSAAFGSPVEAELVRDIRRWNGYQPGWSLVAVDPDDSVLGHVMVTLSQLKTVDGGVVAIPMLSPLAVRPDRQRHGIGGALVRAVAELVDLERYSMLVLQGSPEYYARHGFRPALERSIAMRLPSWAPLEAAQYLSLTNDDPSLSGELVDVGPFADLPDE